MKQILEAKALADELGARWDANENESNPLDNGKLIRIGFYELTLIQTALEAITNVKTS